MRRLPAGATRAGGVHAACPQRRAASQKIKNGPLLPFVCALLAHARPVPHARPGNLARSDVRSARRRLRSARTYGIVTANSATNPTSPTPPPIPLRQHQRKRILRTYHTRQPRKTARYAQPESSTAPAAILPTSPPTRWLFPRLLDMLARSASPSTQRRALITFTTTAPADRAELLVASSHAPHPRRTYCSLLFKPQHERAPGPQTKGATPAPDPPSR